MSMLVSDTRGDDREMLPARQPRHSWSTDTLDVVHLCAVDCRVWSSGPRSHVEGTNFAGKQRR